MSNPNPFRFQITEIDTDVYKIPLPEFESLINLELAIAQKEQREYLMNEYHDRNPKSD